MKAEKPQTPDDIELVPDAWDRFVRAVKQVAKHDPVEHPTRHGKASKPSASPLVVVHKSETELARWFWRWRQQTLRLKTGCRRRPRFRVPFSFPKRSIVTTAKAQVRRFVGIGFSSSAAS